MKTFKFIILAALAVTLNSCVANITPQGLSPLREYVLEGKGRDKVLLIDISGPIFDKEKKNMFGSVTESRITSRVREELDRARKDKSVKGVLLRLNTPGGSVTTCDIIHHEIKKFKEETGVYVVAEFLNLSASGGYYIASAANEIIAHPTTITGAVGVISVRPDVTGLMDKIGVKAIAIKSSSKKDMGSPFRHMTNEERKIYQSLIDELFDRFKEVVSEGRPNVKGKAFETLTDGRILSAKKALELGAIDKIGYMDDAIDSVEKGAGITDALVVTYGRGGSYKPNVFSHGGVNVDSDINLLNIDGDLLTGGDGSPFMYMWMP